MKKNIVYNEDCIKTCNNLKDKSINGIITSPPYNMNVERSDCYYNNGYSHIDKLEEKQYISIRIKEFKEFSRILKDDGVICYNISYGKENPILPVLLMSELHKQTDLTVADVITWKKQTAIPFQTSPTKLSRITELIYIIVKKDHLHTFKTNKEVSKINEKTGQKFYKNYTNFIEAANNDNYKPSTMKASFSQELVNKLINIYFPKNAIIYDPFNGIGTTSLSCINNDRYYIGSEILSVHYKTSVDRIKKLRIKKIKEYRESKSTISAKIISK